jgi:hypothetical protein
MFGIYDLYINFEVGVKDVYLECKCDSSHMQGRRSNWI